MALHKLLQTIGRRRRSSENRLLAEIPVDVLCQGSRRVIAAVAILLQRLHHDPVQLTANLPTQAGRFAPPLGRDRGQSLFRFAQPCAWLRWLLLANGA